MKRAMFIASAFVIPFVFWGCGGEEVIVVDQTMAIDDKTPKIWKVEPGSYRIDLNATGGGANLEFEGTSRAKVANSKVYGGTVLFVKAGEIKLSNSNPEITNVTLKVVKIR
jgi:hypothetical protein